MTAPRVSPAPAVATGLFLTLLFAIQNWANGVQSFPRALFAQAIVWGLWLLLTPLILQWARRHPYREEDVGRWLRAHAAAGVGFAIVHATLNGILRTMLGIAVNDNLLDAILANIVTAIGRNVITFAMIVAAYQAVVYHRAVRERDQRAAALELDLTAARLQGLEGRLRPHFLFNTLNAVAALIRQNPTAAEEMIGQLSDLLRASLRGNPSRQVRLADELALVEQYLAIERARFSDRLQTTVNATESASDAQVPHLILLPLVENSIRHGLASVERAGMVSVHADRAGSRLRVTVSDNGVGMGNAPAAQAGSGIGLGGVRARLAHIYGGDQRVDVERVVPSGTRVTLDIPYSVATATAGGSGAGADAELLDVDMPVVAEQ